MGLRLLLLLWGLSQVWASSEVPPGSFTFRALQISSFINSSWARTDGSGWLGELQTHCWPYDSDALRFLLPWSHGNFSRQQWEDLLQMLQFYRLSVQGLVNGFITMLQGDCALGEQDRNLPPHSLPRKGNSWKPAPEGPFWIPVITNGLNLDEGTTKTVQRLLSETCPQLALGLVEAGKSELAKQEKPVAWLSKGPTPGSGHLLLVCHVSGFYPKPVWVMWLKGEQEQPGSRRGDVLPNADGTWYLRVTLDVVAGEDAGLSCRVKHSSLGGQDIVLYWEAGSRVSVGWIISAVVVFLLALILGFMMWRKRLCFYEDIL